MRPWALLGAVCLALGVVAILAGSVAATRAFALAGAIALVRSLATGETRRAAMKDDGPPWELALWLVACLLAYAWLAGWVRL